MGFLRALNTSIGRKMLMAVTGLALCGFLIVHLAGNFLLYAGQEAYDTYARKLHEQAEFLLVSEIILFSLFALHIALALLTSYDAWKARKAGYSMKRSKQKATFTFFPENWMLLSGIVVLGFLILHLVDFTWELRPGVAYSELEPYDKAIVLLQNPISATVYVIGVLILGFHLSHGFWSAFQTLGLNHPRIAKLLKTASILFALLIAFGFASFVFWANFQTPG